MANPFRDPVMRRAYASALAHHTIQHRTLFYEGQPHRLNGIAGPFWRGYHGEQAEQWDAAFRRTIAYAYWSAGRDAAAAAQKRTGPAHA